MRLRHFFSLSVSLCIALLISFSGVSIKAYAITVPSGGHYMTASETRSYIGDSFEVTFWNGSEYVTTTATYGDAVSPDFTEYSESPVGFVGSGTTWLRYYVNAININLSPQYVTVRLNPTYSIFDTEYIYTCLALSSADNVSAATYDSPQSNWYLGGSMQNFYNSAESSANSGNQAFLWSQTSDFINVRRFTYVPIAHTSARNFSTYCTDCTFNGNSRITATWQYQFLVMCPYVSGSASGGSGIFTTGSGSDINVNVNVDMDETNSLLETLISGVSGLVSGIQNLFIPRQSFVEDWKDDMQDLLYDTFSPIEYIEDTLDDLLSRLEDVRVIATDGVVGAVEFPQVKEPVSNTVIIPRTLVNLAPSSLLGVIEIVKGIIDVVATILVFNMFINRFHAVILGEKVVEISDVD